MAKKAAKKKVVAKVKVSDAEASIKALMAQVKELEKQCASLKTNKLDSAAGKKLLAEVEAFKDRVNNTPKNLEVKIPLNLTLKAKVSPSKETLKAITDSDYGWLDDVVEIEVTGDVETEGLDKKQAALLKRGVRDFIDNACEDIYPLISGVEPAQKLVEEARKLHNKYHALVNS